MNARLLSIGGLGFLLLAACHSSPPPSSPTSSSQSNEPATSATVDAAPLADAPPSTGADKCPGGRPRAGNKCEYVYGSCCFDSAEAACRAAGCGMNSCKLLESFPMQPRCDR